MDTINWITDVANWLGNDGIIFQVAIHLIYTCLSLAIAALISVPLGIYVGHTGKGESLIVGSINTLRALPTLGLLILIVLLIAPLIHNNLAFVIPTVVVLVLLAAPPILSGVISGIRSIDNTVIDSARGIGFSTFQIVTKVELPCALPLTLSGVRGATLQVVSTATVAAYVSLNGLGRFILDGRAAGNYAEMAGGAVIIAVMAIFLEFFFALLGRLITSPGITRNTKRKPKRRI